MMQGANYEEINATVILPKIMQCKEETGATDDDLTAVGMRQLPETETGKCLYRCVMEAVGLVGAKMSIFFFMFCDRFFF